MPKVLKKFEFKERGESSYDWNKLLDGQIYQLTKGEDGDYDCKTLTIQAMARNQAAKRGMGIRISVGEDEGVENVTMQAYELTDEQKEARAAASAARKAARAEKGEAESDGDVEGEVEQEEEVVEEEETPAPKPAKGKKGK